MLHLFTPPGANPAQPYSSLAALAAYTRRAGFSTRTVDLNLDFYDRNLTAERLQEESQFVEVSSDPRSNRQYLSYITENIEAAKATLRDPCAFFDFAKLRKAVAVLQGAIELLQIARGGSPGDQLDNLSAEADWVSALKERASDPLCSPFAQYLQSYVKNLYRSVSPGDVVGISITYGAQLIPAVSLALAFRKFQPGVTVIFGGAFLAELEEPICGNAGFFEIADYVCFREGETALVRILEDPLTPSKGGVKPPNTAYLTSSGDVVKPCGYVAETMENLPPPDYSDFELDRYFSPEPVLLIPADRGCWWGKCAYCTCSMAVASEYRERSAEVIFTDMKEAYNSTGATKFFVACDSMRPANMQRLASLISNSEFCFEWVSNANLTRNLTSLAACRALATGGCRQLLFGMESASQRVLNLMHKQVAHAEDYERILENLSSAGVATHLMIFFGFPGETREEAEATLGFVLGNSKYIGSVGAGSFILRKKSLVHAQPEDFDIRIIDQDRNALRLNYHYLLGDSNALSANDASSFLNDALIEIECEFPWMRPLSAGSHLFLYICQNKKRNLRDLFACEQATASQLGAATFRIDLESIVPLVSGTQVVFFSSVTGERFSISRQSWSQLERLRDAVFSLDELAMLNGREMDPASYFDSLIEATQLLRFGLRFGLVTSIGEKDSCRRPTHRPEALAAN